MSLARGGPVQGVSAPQLPGALSSSLCCCFSRHDRLTAPSVSGRGGHWSLTRVIHARAAGRVAPVCRTPARCGGSTANKTGSGSPCWSQRVWVGGGHKLTGFRETLEKRAAAKTRRGRRVAGAGAEGGGRRGRRGWPGRLPAHLEGGGADGCRCLGSVARWRALPGRALSGAGPRGPQVPRERRGEGR